MSPRKLITTEVVDRVGVLTLNRPDKHNALSDAMVEAFEAAFAELLADETVRCILLRAEGKSFCSGRDVTELGRRPGGESNHDFVQRYQQMRVHQRDAAKPVIAAVRGHVLGGGLEIALAADIRLAAGDAQFAMPEIQYGLLPDTGGTPALAALIGPSRTKYLVMSGRQIDAQTALAWGLADFVYQSDQLDESALALAKEIAAKPPLALALAKKMINRFYDEQTRDGLRQELASQTTLFATQDYAEARAAQREKRAPDYKGR